MDEAEHQEYQQRAITAINEFLDTYMSEREGMVYTYEMGFFLFAVMWRMRQFFRLEELGHYAGQVLGSVETALQHAREQEPGLIVLAEDWKDIEGGEEMVQALGQMVRDQETDQKLTVPEEWTT